MKVTLEQVGKKFGKTWIFRKIDLTLTQGSRSVIQGPNGSGKSTLLQIISGFLINDEGTMKYTKTGNLIPVEQVPAQITIAAPYLEVIEELTLKELLTLHTRFRMLLPGISINDAITMSGLERSAGKPIRHYSSGMKQRVRLLLAICTQSDMLLLDEPTSNLDKNAINWYQELLLKHAGHRTIVVSSNHQEQDYPGFTSFFDLTI